ncbi:FBP domain-containing protein [Nocardioides sp. AE5]|uniref:FBP domain-containing protein n=1 Tax=Nocardioides sp. AE5 TaxID=2962573 RepID=UPI0028811A04|nr:FBP domain-containing protein [Nocardioides sp. AE5]MDT0203457.1 FBP domain-containing protein [Nocardioides sp. AE5]
MEPLSEYQIRASFVNCSKGEAQRAGLPDLAEVAWEHLDFLGWPDPSGSSRAYLVVPHEGGLVGLLLRQSAPGNPSVRRAKMCQLCITPHAGDGVCLAVAPKTGASGRKGDSTGIHICRDLACSLYARGRKVPSAAAVRETLPPEARVARLQQNLADFVARVMGRPRAAG